MRVVLLALLLTACTAKHIAVEPPRLIVGDNYTAIERPKGWLTVWALTESAKEKALKELCQSRSYICHLPPTRLGEVFQIQRERK